MKPLKKKTSPTSQNKTLTVAKKDQNLLAEMANAGGTEAFLKKLSEEAVTEELGHDEAVVARIAVVYHVAVITFESEAEYKRYASAPRWEKAKRRPKEPTDCFDFMLHDVFKIHGKASGYYRALEKFWIGENQAHELPRFIKEGGGLDKLRRANSKNNTGNNNKKNELRTVSVSMEEGINKELVDGKNRYFNGLFERIPKKGAPRFKLIEIKPASPPESDWD